MEPSTEESEAASGPITIGTTVVAGGSSYTVNEVKDPAPELEFFAAGVGNRLVAFDITQVGIEQGDQFSATKFSVQDESGYVYVPGFVSADVAPTFGTGSLSAGQTVRGWVTIEVPEVAVLVAILVEPGLLEPRVLITDLSITQ